PIHIPHLHSFPTRRSSDLKRLYKPSVKAGLKLYNQRKIINEQTKHAGAIVNCMLCLFFYSMIADKISCHFDKINAKKDVFNRFVSYNEGNSDQGKERFKMKIAVMTDSTAYIPKDIREKHHIYMLPLS